MLLPHLEPSLQFLTIDYYVIVDIKEDCLFALPGNFVAPVHGVAGCFVKVDWSFPGVPL
jgi:hypothetical protein